MTLKRVTTERALDRIGFGCSHITGGIEARGNLRLLRLAYDLGVRHFDTAPMYGHGTSEDVLAAAFRGERHNISIATKVGIPHGELSSRRQLLRLVATPLRRWTPGLSKLAAKRIYSTPVQTDFSASFIDRSIEKSLAKLKTDYIDVLLLHEVSPRDVSDELLDKLQKLVRQGKVRRLGIGTSVESMKQINAAGLDFEVYQRPWSVRVADESLFADRYQIFHGSILGAIEAVDEKLRLDARSRARLQELCRIEIESPDDIAKVLLLAAVAANPRGLVLFSSRARGRIASYLQFVQSADTEAGAEVLRTLRNCLGLRDIVLSRSAAPR
ncbi:aldo/keto reductase [Bradyrhizobium sp. BRP20]|uniref:aldo/keto reductase n=1 Tax=Bradyrhizobium sp. BRP20 TaxID=2793822 RepID=UPI001CD6C1CB|nr:aldo/keto reductase [Bradyrhizobium sp. BRP20]MCA1433521.1 aldo/keto reductase [Bradyrhizobium sp. BRP20]